MHRRPAPDSAVIPLIFILAAGAILLPFAPSSQPPCGEIAVTPQEASLRLSQSWPPEIRRWLDFVESAAVQYRVDPDLIAAVMSIESGGNPNALSRSGAIGLMQIIPRYHSCASWDPEKNILCGTHILAQYQQRAGGDWRLGLARYNCGEAGLRQSRCRARGGWVYADNVIRLWQSSKEVANVP